MEAAFSERFADVEGDYSDNDQHTFAVPHPFANDPFHIKMLITELDAIIAAH
ncbi:hypothetical protein ALT721_1580001 [Alteromonas alvinellae]|jgi:hypothetical protein|tara:strand:- start:579 stop:734 length:156 start_codon:yes stop_codon:yes gene_type:complete